LEELRDANIDAQREADEYIAGRRDYCTSETHDLNEAITTSRNKLSRDQATLESENTTLAAKEEELEQHRQTLNNLQTQLDDAIASRKANQDLYTEKANKYAKILSVLRELRRQIYTRATTRYESSSFLQKNQVVSLAQIKETATELKGIKGWGRMVNFLAAKVESALTEDPVAPEDEAADSGLAQILEVIDALIRRFEEENSQNEKWNNEDLEAFNKVCDELNPKIESTKQLISGLETIISRIKDKIHELEGNIANYETAIAQKEDQLKLLEKSCKESEDTYAKETAIR